MWRLLVKMLPTLCCFLIFADHIIPNDHEVGTIVQPNMIRFSHDDPVFQEEKNLIAGLYLETSGTSARQF